MSKRVGVSNFSAMTSDLIRKYGADVYDALEESIEEVAKQTAASLKTSPMPFKTRTGDYQKDWTWKQTKKRILTDAIVYNKDNYRLTHLLEFGHAKQNGGRTRAYEHIAPANEEAQTKVIDLFLDKLSRK